VTGWPDVIRQRGGLALGCGLAGLTLSAVGWFVSPKSFFIAYLFAELVFVGVALGCMDFLMIHYLTGGKWGWPVRRFFEAATGTLPLVGLLFIPVFFGIRSLYPWATAARVAADKVLQHKQAYLNTPFYIARAIIIFGIWILLAHLLRKWSCAQDATRDPGPTRRLRKLSGPGLVIYPLTTTVAFVDWAMSLEADWYSTMFPLLICIGQMLSGLAFVILLLRWLGPRSALSDVISRENFHHLGSLLLAFTMLWAYMAFSQLLIIWSGDLPHEISWYLHRIAGSWRWVAVFLVLFHFFSPFFLLLSRMNKRSPATLAAIAAVVLGAHLVDVWWMIAPTFYPGRICFGWVDAAALLGIGGLWFFAFTRNLERSHPLPVNDPRFAMAVHR